MTLPLIGGSKPDWLKVRLPGGGRYAEVREAVRGLGLTTVCEEARCPNVAECWGGGTATVMLLGGVCTRGCRFCHVQSGNPGGLVDEGEPARVADGIARLGITYVVLTSVDRDDLPDGGAEHFARTVQEIRARRPDTFVEVLIPDFLGDRAALDRIVRSQPDVIGHNIETVERLTPAVRDRRCGYRQSLAVLAHIKTAHAGFTKSSLMLGLGETDAEVEASLGDLRSAGVDIVTIGQYLRPSPWHLPVVEYVAPPRFAAWEKRAGEMGFLYAAAGPLVRSSYRAGELFLKGLAAKRRGASAVETLPGTDPS